MAPTSHMQFVEFLQFFLELSNCRIWILAIWRKKVTCAGILAMSLFTSAPGSLSNLFSHCQSVKFSHNQSV